MAKLLGLSRFRADLLCTVITQTGMYIFHSPLPPPPVQKKGKTTFKENVIPFVVRVRLRMKSNSSTPLHLMYGVRSELYSSDILSSEPLRHFVRSFCFTCYLRGVLTSLLESLYISWHRKVIRIVAVPACNQR